MTSSSDSVPPGSSVRARLRAVPRRRAPLSRTLFVRRFERLLDRHASPARDCRPGTARRTSRKTRHARVGQHTKAHSRQIGPGKRASPASVQPAQLQGSSSEDGPTAHSRDYIAAAAYANWCTFRRPKLVHISTPLDTVRRTSILPRLAHRRKRKRRLCQFGARTWARAGHELCPHLARRARSGLRNRSRRKRVSVEPGRRVTACGAVALKLGMRAQRRPGHFSRAAHAGRPVRRSTGCKRPARP